MKAVVRRLWTCFWFLLSELYVGWYDERSREYVHIFASRGNRREATNWCCHESWCLSANIKNVFKLYTQVNEVNEKKSVLESYASQFSTTWSLSFYAKTGPNSQLRTILALARWSPRKLVATSSSGLGALRGYGRGKLSVPVGAGRRCLGHGWVPYDVVNLPHPPLNAVLDREAASSKSELQTSPEVRPI